MPGFCRVARLCPEPEAARAGWCGPCHRRGPGLPGLVVLVTKHKAAAVRGSEELVQGVRVQLPEEVQAPAVAQVRGHVREPLGEALDGRGPLGVPDLLVQEPLREALNGRGPLGVPDILVALLERAGLEPLPAQAVAQEAHKHVAQHLQAITMALVLAQVSVDAHAARRARSTGCASWSRG